MTIENPAPLGQGPSEAQEEQEEQKTASVETMAVTAINQNVLLETINVDGVPQFAMRDRGGASEVVPNISGDGCTIVPLSTDCQRQSRVILPTGLSHYGSAAELDARAEAFVTGFCALPKEVEWLVPLFIRCTWLPEWSRTAPILRLSGSQGSGKSRARRVIGKLCRKPYETNGSTTVAAFMRNMDRLGTCTAILDETEYDPSSEMQRALRQVLKIGFDDDGEIERCTESKDLKDKGQRVDRFAVFGPKITAAITHDPDEALASRCIPVFMKKSVDIVPELPATFESEVEAFQNQYLQWRFDNYFQTRPEPARLPIDSRLFQLYLPLARIAMAPGAAPERFEALKAFFVAMNEDLDEEQSDEEIVAMQLLRHIGSRSQVGPLPYSAILPVGWERQRLGTVLTHLGIEIRRIQHDGARERCITASFDQIRSRLKDRGYE